MMVGLVARVAAAVRRFAMFSPEDRIAVAVSGGADSVCLLHVLVELAAAWQLKLSVIHLNHRLRGAESDGDADFVRALADSLGLPCTIRDAQLAAGNVEAAGRAARLAFFRETIASGAARFVATGHTRNDQAETVLFRFLRGAGSAGLAGVRPVTTDGIVRPLLETERAEVEAWLKSRHLSWREDSSNQSLDFARNRIRHEVLPFLRNEANPRLTEMLARTAEWARAEEEFWDGEMARIAPQLLERRNGAILICCSALRSLPLAVARRVVRYACGEAALGFEHVERILELARAVDGCGEAAAPGGLRIVRSFDWLRFGGAPSSQFHLSPQIPGCVCLPGEIELCLELLEKSETSPPVEYVYNTRMGFLDWERVSGPLLLRNWHPGDRFQPHGSTGEHKIKALFQKARVPVWERSEWPVLTDGSGIVWTRRFGAAAALAPNAETHVLLTIRETETA
ncbi:MAG TPA: tRNA lysidine(34) synthetase TilS [Candidatus Limnocylindrales bacterium]|nr:tRNA lysidine(34) synthetase TilS [Candidatus Limnocylindrales bacterium]